MGDAPPSSQWGGFGRYAIKEGMGSLTCGLALAEESCTQQVLLYAACTSDILQSSFQNQRSACVINSEKDTLQLKGTSIRLT